MRLFRVAGMWKDNMPDDDKCMVVRSGPEGPGIYLRDSVLRVTEELGQRFDGGVQQLRLAVGRLVGEEELQLGKAARSVIEAMNPENTKEYMGDCLVHVCLPENRKQHKFMSSCFGEKLVSNRGMSRVEREYLPMYFPDEGGRDDPDKMRGVEGVHLVVASEDKQEAIFRMEPGSNFRIHKENGDVLLVGWSGRALHCHARRIAGGPRRRRKRPLATMGEVIQLHKRRANG